MINEKEKEILIRKSKEYGIEKTYLFGSSVYSNDYNDIDLAVEGLQAALFFKFYAEISQQIIKNIDLIDLNIKSKFNDFLLKDAVILYAK